MSDWQRRPGLACEFCGGPGHLIPIPVPISALVCVDDPIAQPMPTSFSAVSARRRASASRTDSPAAWAALVL